MYLTNWISISKISVDKNLAKYIEANIWIFIGYLAVSYAIG